MTAETDLSAHLTTLGLPDAAHSWLLDLWNVIQVLDDAYDGGNPGQEAAGRAVRAVFLNMPLNDFYRQYAAILQPVLVLQVLKWEAANVAEAAGQANEKSYVWRAGYYDVVAMVCHLCGISGAHAAMEMYGETYTEYLEGQTCPAP